jgi:NADH-quinone oxidoreductase subunit C
VDFRGIHDRLRAIDAPGLTGADEPRMPDPENKKDKGRSGDPFVLVDPNALPAFLQAVRDDERLKLDMLIDLTATDPGVDDEQLWINVQLISMTHRHRLAVKCFIEKKNPVLPTTVQVHRTSQWHERECAEMFGITFEGHPDPRNILLPDDWVGSPMRKDYEYPDEYHGISCK